MKNIRNFCIIAHIDHGKSTLADRLIELTQTLGAREMENQVLDDMDLEKEKGITIKSHAIQMEYTYKGEKYILNLIDTPGHVDFSYEVSRSIASCEGALLVVDASQGVQAQTISNLYQAIEHGLEIIPVLNKIDMDSARPEVVTDEVCDLLGCKPEEVYKVSARTGEGVPEILDAIGELPIPPYLNRKTQASDLVTYQTVYSRIKGSVAAPTAGLHFTERVLQEIDARGIERQEVTLHVGAGTFKPVKSECIGEHDMHTEHISVNRSVLKALLQHGAEAIAVGTTSVRTLESLYYMGIRAHQLMLAAEDSGDAEELHVQQWEPYAQDAPAPAAVDAILWLLQYMDAHELDVLHSSTQIIIAPGYRYHIVKMMVTNFHQPQSTLLLLVSAFEQGDWRTIYDYALAHDFRFLSYGDSSLLIP